MLNNTKLEIHTEVATDLLEKPAVTSLDAINQSAANASEMAQDKRIQRRLRRQSRMRRNAPASLHSWRVSMW